MTDCLSAQNPHQPGKTVVVVGTGNIGSHVVPHLGRMPNVIRVIVIDPETYEEKNLGAQDITRSDVGKPKAAVQSRRLRRINPDLDVKAVVDAIENVPLGYLRGDVVLACLDSREARRSLNQLVWRLGVPLIDAGVEGGGLLARVTVFAPRPEAPCLECAWDEGDYATLAQRYPCQGRKLRPAPTNSPSCLGALAASLQALECQKLLGGEVGRMVAEREVVIDAGWHRHYVTSWKRNQRCRFDHDIWHIEQLHSDAHAMTIGEFLELGQRAGIGKEQLTVRVEGHAFVHALTCLRCGETRSSAMRLSGRLPSSVQTCLCGGNKVAAGLDQIEHLIVQHLSRATLKRSLGSVGLKVGDVVSLGGNGAVARHYQLGGTEWAWTRCSTGF